MGRRTLTNEVRRGFWRGVRAGRTSEVAARAVGVSGITGRRWFVQAGGMCPISLDEPSGRYLSLAEREEIAIGLAREESIRSIAARLGRAPSTVSREVRRGSRQGYPRGERYRAVLAQHAAEARARRPKPTKLAQSPRLRTLVQAWLAQRWSPEEISGRLRLDFPDDEQMRISHETIYRALYVQTRGQLRKDLYRKLALRRKQRAARGSKRQDSPYRDAFKISDRPAEVEDRAVPGHWEADLILGTANGSAVGTLVERSTRFVVLLHLPNGHDADEVAAAMIREMSKLPQHLRRSITYDRGTEMARYADIQLALNLPIYFCNPASPWQRGSNENTNRLLRFWLEKGTDLSNFTAEDLDQIAAKLNARPRPTLDLRTPAACLNQLLHNDKQVA
jgi:IS30 family transposase